MKLRNYQQAAVDTVYDHLRHRDGNPVAVLPTSAGKSLVLAKIASDAIHQWNSRVLILAHVKELLEQNADKVRRLCPDIKVGLADERGRRTGTEHLLKGCSRHHSALDAIHRGATIESKSKRWMTLSFQ